MVAFGVLHPLAPGTGEKDEPSKIIPAFYKIVISANKK